MDEKKGETFQSSEDLTEKSESEPEPVYSTEEDSSIDKKKSSEEDISDENKPEASSLKADEEPDFEEESIPLEEGTIPEKEEEALPEKEEGAKPEKEEVPTPPKEVIIVKEVEEKPKEKIIKIIKRTTLIVFILIGLIFIGGVYAWMSGMDDLRDDNDYLIVVVFKEAEAASIYHRDTGESEIIEVTELEKISDRKRFFESAKKKYGMLDRMIIIDVETLKLLSTDDYILYKEDPEKRIYRDEMYDWIIGRDFPRPEIQGNDSPSVVNANMLKSWLDHYEEKLFKNWGIKTIKVVLNDYRSGKIIIHPGNSALTILKYIPVEKIFFLV